MKTKNRFIGLLILMILILAPTMVVSGQKNGKGGPPPWAPAHGYRAKTRHVYFPDYNFYFDVQKNVYIYLIGDRWQVSVELPSIYAEINLRNVLTVELELETDTPQIYNAEHITKYKVKGKKRK